MTIDDIKALIKELNEKINPQYVDMKGTESNERKRCIDALTWLMQKTENG